MQGEFSPHSHQPLLIIRANLPFGRSCSSPTEQVGARAGAVLICTVIALESRENF